MRDCPSSADWCDTGDSTLDEVVSVDATFAVPATLQASCLFPEWTRGPST